MILLIDLPKPIHGMSNVNQAIYKIAREEGLNVKVINTVPSYAAQFFGSRVWGVIKLFHTFYSYFRLFFSLLRSCNKIVYRSINGGYGQLYDLFYVLICRLFRVKLIIHHHSFNYLNEKKRLFHIFNTIAGKRICHVVLGQRMKHELMRLYAVPEDCIIVVSNIAFFNEERVNHCLAKNENVVIGHLANLCIDKGIGHFISLCKLLAGKNIAFEAKIAGPIADRETEDLLLGACQSYSQIQYLGPLYGDEKKNYFRNLDVFVFPSQYKNEAEPLVLYEAAQFGVLNIGTKRGCMETVIESLGGYSFDLTSELIKNMAQKIETACYHGEFSVESRSARINKFNESKENALSSLNKLMLLME